MHGSRNDARKFFQKKLMSEGFKSKASFCKDQNGNMVTDIKSSLELWRSHFNATLHGDDTNNPEMSVCPSAKLLYTHERLKIIEFGFFRSFPTTYVGKINII